MAGGRAAGAVQISGRAGGSEGAQRIPGYIRDNADCDKEPERDANDGAELPGRDDKRGER